VEKIVGLIGSPRNLGNSELMIKEISRNIPMEHELILINLTKIDVKLCTGCYKCLFEEGKCSLKDDLAKVITILKEASGVILVAPTYFLGAYCAVKILSDRGLMVLAEIEAFYGKPAVVVALAGIEGKEGSCQTDLASSAVSLGFVVKDQVTVYAALPGEVFISDKNRDVAAHLGKILLDPNYVRVSKAHECSVCLGNAFKFLGNDRVECLSCHNSGHIEWVNDGPIMHMTRDPKNIVGDLESRLLHRKWLVGMKQKFLEKRELLKSITCGYREEGKWMHNH